MSDEVQEETGYLVEVAPLRTDSRFRLVLLQGVGWMPMSRATFEAEVSQLFPGIDLQDPRRVHWADRPWEWPR